MAIRSDSLFRELFHEALYRFKIIFSLLVLGLAVAIRSNFFLRSRVPEPVHDFNIFSPLILESAVTIRLDSLFGSRAHEPVYHSIYFFFT